MIPFTVIRDPAVMRECSDDARRDGLKLALVPTMGALHDGHLALIREARRRADRVIVSIFVNPTQFGPGEDFERYPRDEAGDVELARSAGADLVFAPAVHDMYPRPALTRVRVDELSAGMCGDHRPGHFDGVALVVAKLFHLTKPHLAVFGQKDYQQLAVIRRMTADLDFGIEIASVPIVREADGLAMSSRNRYLGDDERRDALTLNRSLEAGVRLFESGQRAARAVEDEMRRVLAEVPAVGTEYAVVRDADTLAAVEHIDGPVVLAVAARVGKTRLIDNRLVGG